MVHVSLVNSEVDCESQPFTREGGPEGPQAPCILGLKEVFSIHSTRLLLGHILREKSVLPYPFSSLVVCLLDARPCILPPSFNLSYTFFSGTSNSAFAYYTVQFGNDSVK
jgi:hypothetical protein